MIMRNIVCFLFLPFLLLLTACQITKSEGFRPLPQPEATRWRAESERLGSGILKAFQQKDFAALQRNTPGELSTQTTAAAFQNSCRNFEAKFGKLTSFSFLTALDTPAFCNLIWVANFMRKGENGGEIRRQLLFRVVTLMVDDRVQVVSYGFM